MEICENTSLGRNSNILKSLTFSKTTNPSPFLSNLKRTKEKATAIETNEFTTSESESLVTIYTKAM